MEKDAAILNLEETIEDLPEEGTKQKVWLDQLRLGQAAEVIKQIEQSLQEHNNNPEDRLWWIYCQLKLKQVPIMALAAPLEEIIPHYQSEKIVSVHFIKVCLSCALQLHTKGQYIISSSLFRHSIQSLDKCSEVNATQKARIQESLIAILKNTHEEIKSNLRFEVEAKEIEAALQIAESFEFASAEKKSDSATTRQQSNPTPSTSPSNAAHFSSKSILQIQDQDEELDNQPWDNNRHTENTTRNWLTSGILSTLLLFALVAVYFAWQGNPNQSTSIQLVSAKQNLLLPSIDQKAIFRQQESERIVSDLRALSDKLKSLPINNSDNSNPSEEVDPLPNNSEVESEITPIKTKPTPPKPSLNNLSEDELYYEPGTFGDPQQKQPRLDPREILSPTIEQLDINKNVNRANPTVKQELHEDSRGRRFGKEIDADKSTYGRRKDLQGNPLKGHEVVAISPPQHYRTIVQTDVLSHPSFVSNSLVRLDENATVLAVAKMGQWLEIRSAQGRVGYILAQDVVEENSATN